jgi:hypothetical protein
MSFMVETYRRIFIRILKIEKILETKIMLADDRVALQTELQQLLDRVDFLYEECLYIMNREEKI